MKRFFEQPQQIFNDELTFWATQAEKELLKISKRTETQRESFFASLEQLLEAQRETAIEIQTHSQDLAKRQWTLYKNLFTGIVP